MSVYKVVELIGTSSLSWDDAAKSAVQKAGATIHDVRNAEVTRMDIKFEQGQMLFRTRMHVSFKVLQDS